MVYAMTDQAPPTPEQKPLGHNPFFTVAPGSVRARARLVGKIGSGLQVNASSHKNPPVPIIL